MKPLLDADEVARFLNVKRGWVYAAARAGRMPYVRVGRYRRFSQEQLEAWLQGHTGAASAATARVASTEDPNCSPFEATDEAGC